MSPIPTSLLRPVGPQGSVPPRGELTALQSGQLGPGVMVTQGQEQQALSRHVAPSRSSVNSCKPPTAIRIRSFPCPGGGPALKPTTLCSPAGPLLGHTAHQPFSLLPHPAPASYLLRAVQPSIPEVMAAMEVRLAASTKVAALGSWPGREAGRARVGMAASGCPALPVAPPTHLPSSASCPLETRGPLTWGHQREGAALDPDAILGLALQPGR